MKSVDAGHGLQRFLQALADAESALTGPGPESTRQAVEILSSLENILKDEIGRADKPDRASLYQAQLRLDRIRRLVEFGAAYWSGLVSCSVAAEAYGPARNASYGEFRTGDLHG
jgi:hypothetical protein